MHLTILKILFVLNCLILTILLILRELGITKKMSPMKASDFVSTIAGFLFAYITIALLLAISVDRVFSKAVTIIIAISPFIIGKLVTYQKVKIYSIIQILCVIFSLIYVLII